MATCTEALPEPRPVPPKEYLLRLNQTEAEVLLVVLGQIAGSPARSYRREAEGVYYAISEGLGDVAGAGMPCYAYLEGGGLRFRDGRAGA